ncbi:hypothetical protein HQ346_14375 [Rhodococcus sp. BP-252]|nr:hypothetical protein [Rhodococcus sp. BP-320]MBY6417594.1 hypothetical protein [Rhodococcus sp. BP-321]MBY6423034.1 hypothetical protein [Rhodococcus sp. BP-324]MBY6427618.1 hypothetical protein [Rhodococcus sp. BP-323]MBY6432782.1 hypothetical protein [Rhodococcus sp. BP-322]MBY6441602.1 hypothetical protein [Rhodococcus sp. BP-319]MBY6446576.1 hypothetical protein [Rhodococcus sp. BP-318]MBY6451375.1 hypothetical protein [Rhodococcus sp. BP-315]MBY6456151.1 hypothetical protein [Rhodoc
MTALLLAVAVLAGCSDRGSHLPEPPSIPAQQWNPGDQPPEGSDPIRSPATAASALPPAAGDVDRGDPDSVAAAALTIWFTWDTSVDAGPNDAAARTAPLLTDTYARDITATTAQSSPGAQWLSWAAHSAVLTPSLLVDDEPTPPQTDEVAYRAYRVTQTIDGTPAHESIAAVVLRRGEAGWEVSRIQDK